MRLQTEPRKCRALRVYLSTLRAGPLPDISTVESLLADSWNQLSIDIPSGMNPDKLYGRMESCAWEPPLLRFLIERHGGTVCGSSRAELQQWTINVSTCAAECAVVGHRQIRKMQPTLDVQPLVNEIAELVLQRRPDPRMKWYPDGRVAIRMDQVLPETHTPKQTRERRRRRFPQNLDSILVPRGWKNRGLIYLPPESSTTVYEP
jgi:hypothetical protein